MAGIGFELKRIFKDLTISNIFKGFSYGTFISVGPMLTSILIIISIGKILNLANIPLMDREMLKSAIMYACVFSMINVSGFIMIISRYIADKIYIKDTDDILASLIGVISICLLTSGIVGGLFYLKSSLPLGFKFLSYMIFLELSILYIVMSYISAVKDYKNVAISFIAGIVLAILTTLFLKKINIDLIISSLIGIATGFFIIIIALIVIIKKYFGVMTDKIYSFLPYIRKHPMLFLTNVLYTLGIFVHNIIFWKYSNISLSIMDTYYFAPAYDTAAFLAILTTIPAAILFVVKVETSFYEKYRDFCSAIVDGGSLKDLISAREKMIDTLKRELTFIMEIQLIITILLIILGVNIILPLIANDRYTMELYVFLCIGFFMTYMSFIIITILIYFDNQKDSLIISGIFLITNIIFTFISIYSGEAYYGLGFDLSALITLIVSIHYLNKNMKYIDYQLFANQQIETKI